MKYLINGFSVEEYLKQLMEQESSNPHKVPARHLSVEEWAHEFEEWADSFPEAPSIPDEALSRENLYPDRNR